MWNFFKSNLGKTSSGISNFFGITFRLLSEEFEQKDSVRLLFGKERPKKAFEKCESLT